ncbi:MAG: insulinase family protein [Planctomycetaceae bacterium]|jgi:Zn-dependent M16 (insulinase) family peptidase|nr:insulinase family protein [Planctomycetaceae bacterium]
MKNCLLPGLLLVTNLLTTTVNAQPSEWSVEVGQVPHGFKLLWVQNVGEIKATARMFEHTQSGAPLLYLSCEDDNKVFSIAFRTPPVDDTGIAHIMEHSVLCGSEKFPTKEPFVDLLKSSLQTFLNAFTSDDRTVYPVASRNDKDFMNLMDVYLDAVFFPRVVKTPEILMQEGWHYQVDPENGDLKYNGIVFNEMKGVYSSPQNVLYRTIQKLMYPDSTYTNDSGGNPDSIPNLTFQRFCDFHAKFYHPSNSMIYLYGNGDIEKHLAFIDKLYLSRFNRQTIRAEVKTQPDFAAPKDLTATYSIDETDSKDAKTFLSQNYLLPDDVSDIERQFGMNLLTYILANSDAAPLKRALLDAEIGMDIQCGFDSSIKQPCFSIIVTNSEPEKKAEFAKIIDKTLRDLVKNGIDRKLIEGALNSTEFQLREFQTGGFPKGLAINMQILPAWGYGANPLLNLQFEPVLAGIRSKVDNGYFEKLIRKHLLDNPSRGLITLVPQPGLEKENAKQLADKLLKVKNSLTEQQLAEIKKKQQVLIESQEAPDRPEDVAKIPTLTRDDLNPKAEVIPFEKTQIGAMPVLNVDVDTNKIAYVDVYFDTARFSPEQVPYLSLLSDLLGRVNTEHYTYAELSSEVDIHTGGISTGLGTYTIVSKPGNFNAMFSVSTKVMIPQLEKGLELVLEEINHSQFGDIERLKEIVRETRVGYEQAIMAAGRGSTFPQTRARSYFSPIDSFNDKTGGVDYYLFLTKLEKRLETEGEAVAKELQAIAETLFSHGGNGVTVVTLPKEDFEKTKPVFAKFDSEIRPATVQSFPVQSFPVSGILNEGVIIPSRVQYVVKAADYQKSGFRYSGKMLVLAGFLRTSYLWDNIRVLGGAYGGGITITRSGSVALWSYRDPHLQRTVDVFDGAAEYLEKLELSDEELTKAVIATIGGLDKPLTPAMKGGRVAAMYFSGLTQDDYQREWEEVLDTRVGNLREYAKMLRDAMKQNIICVFGNSGKIEEDKTLFQNTLRILE